MEPKEFYVAGVKFHQLKSVISEMVEGDLLELEPEPTNKYDPNAVKILFNDTMLGYVPAKISPEISAAIETSDEPLNCEVIKLTPSAKPWEKLKVRIS